MNASLTVGDLRAAIESLPRSQDGESVIVWLPGSRIDLSNPFFRLPEGGYAIEGNVRAGSALDD